MTSDQLNAAQEPPDYLPPLSEEPDGGWELQAPPDDAWPDEPLEYDTSAPSDFEVGPPVEVLQPGPDIETLTKGLNLQQATAVRQTQGAMLVVAGPGSGKTRVLTHRIAAILASGVQPWRVCAVTFTNKAAREMRERTKDLVGQERASAVALSTFHSLCARILRRDPIAAGLAPGFGIADADDSKTLIRRIIGGGKESANQAREIADRISRLKSDLVDPVTQFTGSSHPTDRALADVAARYAAELAAQNLVDFDDLIGRTVALLESDSNAAHFWRQRFSHLLVDEFQDTNAAQYRLLHLLADDGHNHNVCVVGDPKQSIYGWRGASARSLDVFHRDHPDLVEVVLTLNYRSTPQVCAVSAAVIAPIAGADGDLQPASEAQGEPVRLTTFGDSRDEASTVAAEIAAAGPAWCDSAVLYRTNAQSLLFETELSSHGVPYEVIGGQRFYDRAEVRDVIAWLRLVANPSDVAAFERAASTPKRGLGTKTLQATVEAARFEGCTLVEVLTNPPDGVFAARAAAAVARFSDDVATVRNAFAEGPAAAVEAVLGIEGFMKAATAASDRVQLETERRENLEELRADAGRFTTQSDPGTATLEYLEQVALRDDDASEKENPDRVGLMTVHAAKGREFERVWVVGVEDSLFPHRSSVSEDEVDEERRLLFVAVSRAASKLALSLAQRRQVFGNWDEREPSPFLDGLEDLVEVSLHRSLRHRFGTGTHGAGRRYGSVPDRPGPQSTRRRAGSRMSSVSRPPRQTNKTSSPKPTPPRRDPEWVCDPSALAAGVAVQHASFGPGEVVSATGDEVTVRFGNRDRTLLVSVAPLQLL